MNCLECGSRLTPSKTGPAKRFCSSAHRQAFNNRAQVRGVHAYHLLYAHRMERTKSQQMGLWNALCQLVIAWRDEDEKAGRTVPAYKPPELALDDIHALDRCIPSTNLYIREKVA